MRALNNVELKDCNKAIVAMVVANNGQFIDGHTDNRELLSQVDYLIVFKRGDDQFVCPAYDGAFCLTPLNIFDGEVYSSTRSVGGVIMPHQHEHMTAAAMAYNTPDSHGEVVDIIKL